MRLPFIHRGEKPIELIRVVHMRPRFMLSQTRPWSCSVLMVCAVLYLLGVVALAAAKWAGLW